MHCLLAYTGNNSGPANNFDLAALTDPNFSQRNGHYIFTEQYGIGYLGAQSAHMTDARLLTPTFAALNSDGMRIAGFQQKAGVGGVPTLYDKYTQAPVMMPMMEELQGQGSTGTAEQQWLWMHLLPSNWNNQIPAGPIIMMEATVGSFTPTANVWSGPQALTFNANPRGGVYAVIRASLQFAADTLLFRLIFPRDPVYKGRHLRPGWVAQNAVGSFEDVITQINPFHLGVWGWFHTFEPPQIEVLNPISAATTPTVRLWCVYLGGDLALLNQLISQNSVA